MVLGVILSSEGEQDLSNGNSSSETSRLSKGTSHTSLKSIGSGTGKHLIDTQDVERVNSDSHVEGIFSGGFNDVLVSTDTSGFDGFRRKLF